MQILSTHTCSVSYPVLVVTGSKGTHKSGPLDLHTHPCVGENSADEGGEGEARSCINGNCFVVFSSDDSTP